uniref:Solute carrier family 8 member 2a n=1 Tax=Tetraodon nigroviridis TaxID=99883 RepID=H3CKN4_TETNG
SGASGDAPGPPNGTCSGLVVCKPGLLLPVWTPLNPSPGQQAGRAVVYFLGLIYLFLGVSIIADRFMASIEVITSQEKEVTLTGPGGAPLVRRVRVWNETVSNLTLMALGSSAPEILLSVIEVCGHGFAAGALGPGTIVGSAAFNMLVIVGVCVLVVPDGETRRIQRLPVYLLTASWSVLAYVWLYLILAVSSPGIVEVWETALTHVYFPFVLLAWLTDRRLLSFTRLRRRRNAERHGIVGEMEGDLEMEGVDGVGADELRVGGSPGGMLAAHTGQQVDQSREEVLAVLRDLRLRHPDKDLDQLTHMAAYWVLQRQRRSRAFYRVQVTRMLTGSGNVLRNYEAQASCCRVGFERARYQCMENCGAVCLGVSLTGGTGRDTFLVDYCTENGSARAGADYGFRSGTLVFGPGEGRQEIQVDVLDDEVFEEDKHFFVRLQNLRLGEDGCEGTGSPPRARLAEPLACVTILDDDHAGVFVFGQQVLRRDESGDTLTVAVLRNSGSRGPVALAYRTEDSSAAAGGDYQRSQGLLRFADRETSQTLKVQISRVEPREEQRSFFIVLEEPRWQQEDASAPSTGGSSLDQEDAGRLSEPGKPVLGERSRLEVVLDPSPELRVTVDTLVSGTSLALVMATHSWREQFAQALSVGAAAEQDGEAAAPQGPGRMDYFLHFLCLFWKVVFACIPPTQYWNGWACFCVSVVGIGLLTALIGDLASHFGCTVGLRDSVTALVFVALGTSLPDTFASKVAATQDRHADACVGNVTGSNSVNVFLGIGVAWTVAALYWHSRGEHFRVEPGSLAFSVTLFTVFALLAMAVLWLRRRSSVGGELGGPRGPKVLTALLFFGLWLLYVLLSSLEAYCHLRGF